jgi:two-component system response regulator
MSSSPILLVEDNADDEALTLRALKQHNLADNVHVVRDGAEALDYLLAEHAGGERHPAAMPAVVLLDLMLPKVSGLDVLKRVRDSERTKLLPVVVLTSSDEAGDIQRSYELGANSYVCKPVDFSRFSRTVSQLGQYWLSINQTPAASPHSGPGRPAPRDE